MQGRVREGRAGCAKGEPPHRLEGSGPKGLQHLEHDHVLGEGLSQRQESALRIEPGIRAQLLRVRLERLDHAAWAHGGWQAERMGGGRLSAWGCRLSTWGVWQAGGVRWQAGRTNAELEVALGAVERADDEVDDAQVEDLLRVSGQGQGCR